LDNQTSLSLFNEYELINEVNPEFSLAQQELLKHVRNKDNYRANQYKIFSNATITENFEGQNKRRSYFFACNFNESSFKKSGFTGSYFVDCVFENCPLDFAIFDGCYFKNCKIYYNEMTTSIATR